MEGLAPMQSRKLEPLEHAMHLVLVGNAAVLQRRAGSANLRSIESASKVAAAALAARHPSLRRAICASPSMLHKFYADATHTMRAEDHVEARPLHQKDDVEGHRLSDDGRWVRDFSAAMHDERQVRYGKALWRIVLLVGQHHLVSIVVFNHAIGDGFSSQLLQHDFLTLLSHALSASSGPPALPLADPSPPPPLRALLRPNFVQRFTASFLVLGLRVAKALGIDLSILTGITAHFLPRTGRPSKNEPLPIPYNANRQYAIVRRGREDGQALLLAECRKRGCTIGGFGMASIMFAAASLEASRLGNRTAGKEMSVSVSYDINWRKRVTPEQPNAVGLLISADLCDAKVDTQSETGGFWALAKRCSDQMKEKLKGGRTGSSAFFVHLSDKCVAPLSPTRDMLAMDFDVNFSNVGPWLFENSTFDKLGELQDDFIGSSTTQGQGASMGLIVFFSCVGGHMSYSATYHEHWFGEGYARAVTDSVFDMCEGKVFGLEQDLSWRAYDKLWGGHLVGAVPVRERGLPVGKEV